jgi:hypothetical protein
MRVGVMGAVVMTVAGSLLACANEVEGEGLEIETPDVVNPSGEENALTMPACGTVLATFDGVSAKSNGANTGTGLSCAGQGGVANGLQYQCVELVMRYFKLKFNLRWYGNAKDLLRGAPRDKVDVIMNGDAAHPPVPGDMLVWTNGQWGHTALVTEVGRTYVDIIEQNVSGNGKARLPYDGASIGARWNGWVPAGWAHAKANPRTPGNTGNTGNAGGDTPADDCPNVGATGRVIDDDDGCFFPGGTAAYLHASTEGYRGDLVWTHATADAAADNFARWSLRMARPGTYRIDVYTDTSVAESKQSTYRIVHDGVTDEVKLDQTARNGFRTLGVFHFAAGGDQRVRLNDNTGEAISLQRKIVFDALRVVPACDRLRVETEGATLNVHATAGTDGAVVGQLSPGDVVDRLDTVDGAAVDGNTIWHKVQKGGVVGFSTGKFLGCPLP